MTGRIIPFLLIILTGLTLFSCAGPGYYLQAISGQWGLMHARRDVNELIDNPATGPQLKKSLETATRMLDYAESELDLPANGSYASYVEIETDALVWNVVATKEFSLKAKKWCFPVAGCLPYRGYFNQSDAENFAAGLLSGGLDVIVSPATAYSSLGWFEDPLLSTMFTGSDTRLAAYLFHELAHQRLYLKGDGRFNESYASFVEETGVRAWLSSYSESEELERWQRLEHVRRDFNHLVRDVREELNIVYSSSQSDAVKRQRKSEILEGMARSHQVLVAEKWDGRNYFSAWFEIPLNNARLALFDTYEGGQCAFRNLMHQAGADIRTFHSLAEQQSRLPEAGRSVWLEQTCDDVGPAVKP